VFDEVTKREGGKQAARRGAYVLGSTAFQAFLIFAIITISARIAAKVAEGPLVPVKIMKSAPPPPPPPPPPPARKKSTPKPKTETPKPRPNPMAMVQPKDVPAELKPPNPNEPPEEEDSGADEGVEGGVIGGVVGGQAPQNQGGGGFEDAPVYASGGYSKPAQARPGCVQSSVRTPRDLAGFVSSVTVQFAIRPDGAPTRFSLKTPVPDPRIEQAIWNAIQQCQWIPGRDARGTPVSIWVIMPFRFTGG
jgi:protein TonB